MEQATAANVVSTQEQKAMAYAKKGIILALLSGVIFSLDSLSIEHSKQFYPFNAAAVFLLASCICAGVHDFCAAIITTFMNWRQGRLKEIGRSLATRSGRFVIIGAMVGAIFGMGGYMLALQLADAAYVLPITSLYPAVAAVLAMFVLKEKISIRAWCGLAMCIAGAIAIGYQTPESQAGDLFYLGMACAVFAAIGWGTEGVCATSGMDFIEPIVALNIYYIVSSILYLIILIPAVSIFFMPGYDGALSALAPFLSSKGFMFVIIAGCLGAFSYQCWYRSMNMTGVSRAMALNISYALWGILLSFLFTDTEITNNLIIGAIIIFIGMFLVIGNPKDMLNLRCID